MSIESDTSNLRTPVLNPDPIGEERNVYNQNLRFNNLGLVREEVFSMSFESSLLQKIIHESMNIYASRFTFHA